MAVTRGHKAGVDRSEATLPDTRLWHSQARMSDVRRKEHVIVRGDGAYVWDADGRRLLDSPASLWYCNVGHGRAEIASAVAEQMAELEAYSTFQRYATRPALEVAELLSGLVPIDDARIYLTSGGSDSVEVAAKLARRYWQLVGKPEKTGIVTRELSYHGLHAFGTSIGGLDYNRDGYGELIADTLRVPTNDAGAVEGLLAERGETIAAFFCEPVIGTGGIVPPADGYLSAVERACRDNDVLFVVDEVITGFGRSGAMFASHRFDLRPDVILMAKGITSGYLPLGAVAVAERLWAPFWDDGSELIFHHGLTYSGHASVCSAALANIAILEREDLVPRVRSLEGVLAATFAGLEDHELVKEVRTGVGLLTGVQLHDPRHAEEVSRRCVESGVLMRTITGGTLHVSPPFVIDEDDIAFLARTVSDALDQGALAGS